MKKGIIYKATNLINDKVYIGQTIQSLSTRIRQHYKSLNLKRNYKFPNALNKYEKYQFKWEIIESDIPLENLNNKEIEYIALFDSFNNGYNSNPGGYVRFKRKATKPVLENIKELFNVKTKEKLTINAYDFIQKYVCNPKNASNVYCLFTGKYIRYKNWILYKNLDKYNELLINISNESSKRFKDMLIRNFKNIDTNEIFIGTRTEFIDKYGLSKGMVSQLINNKVNIYKKWIVL